MREPQAATETDCGRETNDFTEVRVQRTWVTWWGIRAGKGGREGWLVWRE